MQTFEFDSVVDGDIIRIPEQLKGKLPAKVRVTVIVEKDMPMIMPGVKAEAGALSLEDFPPIINTTGWRFNREDANERR